MSQENEPKPPAAVVYLEREDGRVLTVPRKDEQGGPDYADRHLMGGKWEPKDGWLRWGEHQPSGLVVERSEPDLVATAIRETLEETGLELKRRHLRAIHDYVTSSGRPVRVFVAEGVLWLPPYFPAYPTGVPAWVPVAMLTLPWCRLATEAAIVLRAVAADRRQRAASARDQRASIGGDAL
ncbi:MAG: NUDIX hydrolase [Phycicoccus sp.]